MESSYYNLKKQKKEKINSVNIDNISTNENMSSKLFGNSNITKSYSGAVELFSKNLLQNNNQNENKNIKKEIFEDVGKKIASFSPTNKEHLQNGTRNSNINLPKINRDVSMFQSYLVPKKLTKKRMEEEIKYMKHFIDKNILNLDDKLVYKNLGAKKMNKNMLAMNDYLMNQKKINRINKKIKQNFQTGNSDTFKQAEICINNPSLGPEYLRKTFSEYFSNFNMEPYENSFRRNYSKRYFGSVLVANRIRKEDDSYKYENVKNTKFTQVSKMKMKWKTIKWILENKKDVLDRLMDFHESILNLSNKKALEFDKGLNKQEFISFMKNNGITNDTGLINKLFWVFDEDGDNELKYKEIAFGIEMFRDSSIEQKLKAFFDLCDVDNSGTISKQEFLNLLRKNMVNNDEKISMKQVVDKIFSSVKLDKKGEITLEKLKEGCEKNREIQDIIYKNLMALRAIDNVIDKDIKNELMRFNPEVNDQLRMKLLSMRISFIPLREEKFGKLMDDFVANREKLLEFNKMREIIDEDDEYYEDEEEEENGLFKEEREIAKAILELKGNN